LNKTVNNRSFNNLFQPVGNTAHLVQPTVDPAFTGAGGVTIAGTKQQPLDFTEANVRSLDGSSKEIDIVTEEPRTAVVGSELLVRLSSSHGTPS
jgi:hypothetical protein